MLVILMLTPALACMMSTCPVRMAQEALTLADMNDLPPCHRAALLNQEQKKQVTDAPMFLVDCMGIDLFPQTASADVVSPDLSLIHIDLSFDAVFHQDNSVLAQNAIRGPPAYFSSDLQLSPHSSLILTTQRFRI